MKLLSTYITRSPLHTRTHMYAHVHTRTGTSRVINSNCNREITVLIVDRSSSTLVAFHCICYVFVIYMDRLPDLKLTEGRRKNVRKLVVKGTVSPDNWKHLNNDDLTESIADCIDQG